MYEVRCNYWENIYSKTATYRVKRIRYARRKEYVRRILTRGLLRRANTTMVVGARGLMYSLFIYLFILDAFEMYTRTHTTFHLCRTNYKNIEK